MHATQDYYRQGLPIHTLVDTLYGYNGLQPREAIRAWFTSNHDENSWNGTEYEKYGEMALPLAVFSCTWNGIPLLYSGQELPLKKRLAFFDKDEIGWGEILLHDFYRKLLSLQRNNPALKAASDDVSTRFVHTDHADKILCYRRRNGHHEVVVMLNFSQWPLDVKIYDALNPNEYEPLLQVELVDGGYPATVHLPGWGFAVWHK
jgi:glycosidase